MSKFKIGDKVRIIKTYKGYEPALGEIDTVISWFREDAVVLENNQSWSIYKLELEDVYSSPLYQIMKEEE